MEITDLTIIELQEGLLEKKFSAKEAILACLERIKKYDNEIQAFITLREKEAIGEAEKADKRISELGKEGFKKYPLLGIPVAHKDLYLTKGIRTTAASRVLGEYVPPYSATVVKRLENAGAITLGKLNCDAWAHGSSGENSDFFPTKNPWNKQSLPSNKQSLPSNKQSLPSNKQSLSSNKEYVPGGSSSGSAAAVAAGFVPAATGTDTGGSIRLPASFCGVVGIKPTYGRVSRYGVVAMASSLDSMGFLTRTVEDAALLLKLVAGKDENDATSLDADVPSYLSDSARRPLTELKIGLPKEYFARGVADEVREAVESAAKVFEEQGAKIEEVSLPHTEYAIPAYYIIMSSEVSSNLARYDGIRYGNPRDAFGSEAKRRIMLGTHALSSGYKDKYYGSAANVRRLIVQDFDEVFNGVGLLLAPVSPTPPFKLGEKTNDPLQMYLSDMLLAAVNLAGLPALGLPCGFTGDNLPIGIQLVGPQLSEDILFKAGYAYQKATDWHKRKPAL